MVSLFSRARSSTSAPLPVRSIRSNCFVRWLRRPSIAARSPRGRPASSWVPGRSTPSPAARSMIAESSHSPTVTRERRAAVRAVSCARGRTPSTFHGRPNFIVSPHRDPGTYRTGRPRRGTADDRPSAGRRPRWEAFQIQGKKVIKLLKGTRKKALTEPALRIEFRVRGGRCPSKYHLSPWWLGRSVRTPTTPP
jgi:hypothetical protein